ncbi:MAG: hypothetical protein IJA97_01290 [Clostridia bacterium]|nr:hypothetical protein [Clostridia bacterium]
MNDKFYKFLEKLKYPPLKIRLLVYALSLLSAIGALLMLLVDFTTFPLSIVAYTLFGIAGVTLSYAVYLVVKFIPTAKSVVVNFMERHDFTYLLLKNYGFRTVIFAIGSFAMSVIFGAFNGVMGVLNRSIWYGALSAYYIALAFLRGGILTYHKRKVGKNSQLDVERDELTKAKIVRNSGIILLVLNVALSSAIAQMIFSDAHFMYFGWTIFAYAAYAFFKMTMAIINIFKANRHGDLTIKAIRSVNLTDATVSILALQTALLATFSVGTENVSLFNTLTGIVVSAFSIGIGIYMILFANKHKRNIQNGQI